MVIAIEEEMAPLAEEVAAEAVVQMVVSTPKRTGDLASSTTPLINVSGLTANIGIIQPAVSQPNPFSGRGGGYPYAMAVIHGRKMVVPLGKDNGGASVLWGPGFGPAMRSRATSGEDYPSEAMQAAEPEVLDLVSLFGDRAAEKIARLL